MIPSAQDVSREALEARLRTILPPAYQDGYEDVQPVSMGSAGLRYGSDGRVAWNEIWKSFCDLAMAGGPPHRGTLLEPGTPDEIATQPGRYRQAAEEITRGITLVTGLEAAPSRTAGWVRVECADATMAGWLLRAIVMENIACRCDGAALFLPAGPSYRIEKEIKNVITATAKTCHYWQDHMPYEQRVAIANLFAAMEQPLLQPDLSGNGLLAEALQQAIGLPVSSHACAGWIGLTCPDIPSAVWIMRMLVASNVLSRREGETVCVPVSANVSETIDRVAHVHALAKAR